MQAAQTLDQVYKTISPEPLRTPEELKAFYCDQLNQVRGQDLIARLKLALGRAWGGSEYKAFLMGHTGVGKSTELSRLIQHVAGQFHAFRFSATSDLDPGSFQPFDVLLLMVAELVERTGLPQGQGGTGSRPSDAILRELWDWFATEKTTQSESTRIAAEVAAGAGVKETSWWAKVLGLFATLKGEIKFASSRETQKVEYRLSRLSSLINVANRLLVECNRLLREATGHEWLVIGEDFDKPGIPPELIEKLFITYSNVFKELRTHLIFTVPAALVYSAKGSQLPFPADRVHAVPDMPVYDRQHKPHTAGRAALQAVLKARVDPALFQKGQIMRLLVASGGILRDLFAMINQAADNALLRGAPGGKMAREDVDYAIGQLRTEYVRRLGESIFDRGQAIPYPKKAERLVRLYDDDRDAQIPDSIMHSLLMARAVQEFDGERWFGVHSIVVDILHEQGRIKSDRKGKVPGGLE